MRTTMISFILIMLSLNAYADKILLTGKPVELVPAADYYTYPKNYSRVNRYPFVRINGVTRVCFLNKEPEFARARLDMLPFLSLKKARNLCGFAIVMIHAISK